VPCQFGRFPSKALVAKVLKLSSSGTPYLTMEIRH
jgi:hypothetical protein